MDTLAGGGKLAGGKLDVSPMAGTLMKMALFLVFCMWLSASIAGERKIQR